MFFICRHHRFSSFFYQFLVVLKQRNKKFYMKKRDTRVGCEVFEATEKWLEKKTHADAACWSQPVYTSFIWKWPYMWSAGTDLKAFHYVRMCHIFFCFLLERKGENIYYLLFLVWRMPLKRLQIQFFGYHTICFLRILSFFYFIVYSQKFFDLFFMPFLSIFFLNFFIPLLIHFANLNLLFVSR